jgi:hypothetical protein
MKFRFVAALAVWVAGGGWILAQAPVASTAPQPVGGPPAGVPVTGSPMGGQPSMSYPYAGGAGGVPVQGPIPDSPSGCAQPAGESSFWGSYFSEPIPNNNCAYLSADYLLWRIRKQNVPSAVQVLPTGVLAITSSTTNIGPGAPPSVNVVNYTPLFIQNAATFSIGNTIDLGESSGGRLMGGFWFDPEHTFGVEAGGFVLDKRTGSFNATSQNQLNQFVINTGFTNTINTFTTTSTGPTLINTVTTPIVLVRQTTSTVTGDGTSALWGLELNGRCTVVQVGGATFGGVFGLRYLNFSEELNINSNVNLLRPSDPALQTAADQGNPPPIPANLNFSTMDSLRTFNQFYGARVGADTEIAVGRAFLYARGTIAVGDTHEVVEVNSTTTNITNGNVLQGGLLSGPLDIGKHSRDRITFVPEAQLRLGYAFTRWLKGYVGYDVLYMNQAVRPSDVVGTSTIATNVTVANSTNTINVHQPTFKFADSEVLVQGLTFGLEICY